MRTGRARAATVTTAALALCLTACGSTVQVSKELSTPQGGQLGEQTGGLSAPQATTGVAVPSTGGAGGPTVPGAQPGQGSTGAVAGGSSGTTPAGPGSGPGAPGGPGRTALSGRGVTATSILVGVGTTDDYDTFAGGLGVAGTSPGDVNAQIKAVVDDINSSGGVAGRKIVLVKHSYSASQQLASPAAANTAACATWTQDNKVYAVLGPLVVEDTLLSCLAKTGTPLLQVGGGVDYPLHYADSYRRFPLFVNLAQMVGERYDRISLKRLKERGFFSPWDTVRGQPGTAPVKVGLVGYDDPDGERQIASQLAQLKANGVTVASDNVVRCPRTLSNCHQSAVLRFSSSRVTHVLGVALLFMNQAESQSYRPRYFVANSARVLAANAPAAQLNGAMGESYIPSYDVETAEYPGDPTPATTRCRKAMKKEAVDITQPSVLFNALMVCDAFYYLRAGANAAARLGGASLIQGLESAAGQEASALTWRSALGPGEHTSARSLRDLTFRTETRRWFYASRTDHHD